MPANARMKHLGVYLGKRWYWADDKKFVEPGLWYWDPVTGKNIRVPIQNLIKYGNHEPKSETNK